MDAFRVRPPRRIADRFDPALEIMSAITALDLPILTFLVEHRVPLVTDVAYALGSTGTTLPVLALVWLGVAAVVVVRRAYRRAGLAAIAMIISIVVARSLKTLIEHPAPPPELTLLAGSDYSFPSTHAAWMVAGAVTFVGARRWRSQRTRAVTIAGFAAFILFIDFCMIYLGSHWFSDVVAGWLLGAVIGAGVLLVGRDRRPREAPAASTRGRVAGHPA